MTCHKSEKQKLVEQNRVVITFVAAFSLASKSELAFVATFSATSAGTSALMKILVITSAGALDLNHKIHILRASMSRWAISTKPVPPSDGVTNLGRCAKRCNWC
jgi:hypothetical protein